MTDETPKPKRKRWRWIIAGVLLFVVGAASWWYWPRGDARFVGKWAGWHVPSGFKLFTIQLSANGRGWNAVTDGSGEWMSFSWMVSDDDALTMGQSYLGKADWYSKAIAVKLQSWFGWSYLPSESRYEARVLNKDSIQLFRNGTHVWTLTRITE